MLRSSRKMRLTCTGQNYQLNNSERDNKGERERKWEERERYQNGRKIGREMIGHRKNDVLHRQE